jgi:hypothetical protein
VNAAKNIDSMEDTISTKAIAKAIHATDNEQKVTLQINQSLADRMIHYCVNQQQQKQQHQQQIEESNKSRNHSTRMSESNSTNDIDATSIKTKKIALHGLSIENFVNIFSI